jgi:hypothetical protein
VADEYIDRIKATIGKYKSDVAELMDDGFWGYASLQADQVAISFRCHGGDVYNCPIPGLQEMIYRLGIKVVALSDGLKKNSNPSNGMKQEQDAASVQATHSFRKEIDRLIISVETAMQC